MNEPLPESGPAPLSPAHSREETDRLIAAGESTAAREALAALWRQSSGPATAGFIVSRFEKLRAQLPFTSCRVAILRSFTIEPVIPLLRATAFVGGIDLHVQLGDFDVYTQEILEGGSALYSFEPQVVILAAHTADAAPDLWENFADLSAAEVDAAVRRVGGHFQNLLNLFRTKSKAHLIIHSLQTPAIPSNGVLDAGMEMGQRQAIESINEALAKTARETNNVYVLDYNALVARHGQTQWDDRRKWLSSRMPIAAPQLIHLARQWMRFIHPITGKVAKAIAVDLDNTLWGGVVGEDGMDGIKLSADHKGGAWRDVQRVLLDLYRRGIILAICSKNNPAEAMEAIAKHPGMLLRPEHFAAVRTNWNDKATNLREIAAELNIGLDAIAFLDDNPVERDWVRRQLPEVTVIELPAEPMGFAAALRDSPVFERLSLSTEDRERGRHYAEQRQRAELQQSTGTIEDFYRSLHMKVEILPVDAPSLARAAQLTQKTNQFNLTTRRYSEEQMAELMRSPQWNLMTIRVVDRFGDNGIVGLSMMKTEAGVSEIDTFLLSCRVIGRTVETAFLSVIAETSRRAGATHLTGRFLPSPKNAPAGKFYASHGFTLKALGDPLPEAGETWTFDLRNRTIAFPVWIENVKP